MRIGHGADIHAFDDGRPLMLGCVQIPHPRGLAGHSDGDALAHAIIDALLGAAGMGDIGGMFPSDDERWAGASGRALLDRVTLRVRDNGFRIANVDSSIVAQEPRLAPHVTAMRRALGDALRLDITEINVKATTSDGLGFTGRGEGIAAFAVVLLE